MHPEGCPYIRWLARRAPSAGSACVLAGDSRLLRFPTARVLAFVRGLSDAEVGDPFRFTCECKFARWSGTGAAACHPATASRSAIDPTLAATDE